MPYDFTDFISYVFHSFAGLEDTAHVLQVKGEIYNAVLGMVDITRGTNSYYKLQVLKGDKSSRFVLLNCYFSHSH
jgi:poly [ADP-ribose] polymerase